MFTSPDAAVTALVAALRANDTEQLRKIFGPAGDQIIWSGDPVADKLQIERFLAAYDERHRLQTEGGDGGGVTTLVTGFDDWPFPVPLVKRGRRVRLRRRRGGGRNPQPAHRPQRAGHGAGVPRDRGRPARVRRDAPDGRRPAAVRPEDPQRPGQEERPVLADRGGRASEPARPAGRQRVGGGLRRAASAAARRRVAAAVPRLLLPPAHLAGPQRARRRDGLRSSTAA